MERPGKTELISDVDSLNERIEELKKLVALKEKEVGSMLQKVALCIRRNLMNMQQTHMALCCSLHSYLKYGQCWRSECVVLTAKGVCMHSS